MGQKSDMRGVPYADFVPDIFRSDKYLSSYARDAFRHARRSSCKVSAATVQFGM
jgi:hypothetical protein